MVKLYCDGACKNNQSGNGKGGWGVYIQNEDGSELKLTGGCESTTNNRMELQGLLEGLKALKPSDDAEIYSDSKYVIDGITKWLKNWKRNGFQTAAKKPVKNDDLWKEIDHVLTQRNGSTKIIWIRGHTGNPGNEIADALANEGVRLL